MISRTILAAAITFQAFAWLPLVAQVPLIEGQPASQSAPLGATVGLRVSATGQFLSFQWFRDGALLPGQTGSTLTLSNISKAASYQVVVSGQNGAATSAVAQVQIDPGGLVEQWRKRFDGPGQGNDDLLRMVVNASGEIYLTGSEVNASNQVRLVLIKLDPAGGQLWKRTYEGPGHQDEGRALALDGQGNVVVAGMSMSEMHGSDFITFKYDPAGNLLWEQRFDSPGHYIDEPVALAINPQGVIAVAGNSYCPGIWLDMAVVTYDPTGKELWTQRYNGPGNDADTVAGIRFDVTGNLLVAGTSEGAETGEDFAVVKYDPSGRQLWVRRYDGPSSGLDQLNALEVDGAGNVFVTGGSEDDDGAKITTLKYSPAGNLLWEARHFETDYAYDSGQALALGQSGEVYVAGSAYHWTADHDFLLIRYSAQGDEEWGSLFGSYWGDFPVALQLDALGRIYLAGTKNGPGLGAAFAVVGFETNGTRRSVAHFNGPGASEDVLKAFVRAPNGDLILAGSTDGQGTGIDGQVVRYLPLPTAAPIIMNSPQSQTVVVGTDLQLMVVVTNAVQPEFRWYRDGNLVPDETVAILDLPAVDVYQGGRYWVEVIDGTNHLVTPRFLLTVLTPPYIYGPITSRGVFEGTEVSLHILADGSPTIYYQWFFNERLLAGATNASLSFPAIDFTEAGSYHVVVSNFLGSVTSAPALIELIDGPVGEIWRRTLDGGSGSYDQGVAVTTDALGNVYVTGAGTSSNYYPSIITVKYAPDGQVLWRALYEDARPTALEVDDSGNVYVVGYDQVYWKSDLLTLRYDANGNLAWANRYNGPADGIDRAQALSLAPDGSIWVGGHSDGGASSNDLVAIHYHRNGGTLFSGRFDGQGRADELAGLVVDANGQVYLTGTSAGVNSGQDWLTLKLSTNGSPIWTNRFSSPGAFDDRPAALALDGTNYLAVGGSSFSTTSSNDFTTILYRWDGQRIWVRNYDAAEDDDRIRALAMDPFGNVIVTGSSRTSTNGYDLATIQYDPAGTEVWVRRFDSLNGYDDEPSAMVVDAAGGIYLTGYLDEYGGTYDYLTLKYDSDGTPAWQIILQGPVNGQDFAADIALDGAGGIFVTGFSDGGRTVHDFGTVKYLEKFIFDNQLPEVEMLSPVDGEILAGPGNFYLSAFADDIDGFINRVEFYQGNTLIGTATRAPFETIWSAAQPGDYVLMARAIDDQGGIAFSAPVRFRIVEPVSVVSPPIGRTVAEYTPIELSVSASGTGLTYQWRLNGVNIPEANGPTYRLDGLQFWQAGSYSVVVANEISAITSEAVELKVNLSPLLVSDQFENAPEAFEYYGLGMATNSTATRQAGEPFHAGNEGGKSLWMKWIAPTNGIATVSTLGSAFDTLLAVYTGTNLNNLNLVDGDDDRGGFLTSSVIFNADAGVTYYIAVDGFSGDSGTIVLEWYLEETQDEIPVIRFEPESQTASRGGEARFEVLATSPTPLQYQWLFNCLPLSGQTNSSLNLTNVQAENVGSYTVQIRNQSSKVMVESVEAYLELGPSVLAKSEDKFEDLFAIDPGLAPAAKKKRAFTSVSAGTPGTQVLNNFGATTEKNEPNHGGQVGGASRWFDLRPTANGTLVVDTRGSAIDTVLAVYNGSDLFSLVLVAQDDNGAPDGVRSLVRFSAVAGTSYLVAVDGVNGVQGNIHLNWGLGSAPGVAVSPTNTSISRGGSVTFNSSVSGGGPVRYQWRFNGVELPGQTNTSLLLSNVESSSSGSYSVVVVNDIGSATSTPPANLVVTGPPVISSSPASQAVSVGGVASFGVLASGSVPFRYQWRRDQVAIANATNRTLTLTNVQIAQAGNYTVVISNAFGAVTSSPPAVLSVQTPPVILADPVSQRGFPGGTIQLTVSVSGTPVSYQWRFNGFSLPGATGSLLVLSNLTPAQSGRYSVTISNQVRTVTSGEAVVAVMEPLTMPGGGIRVSNGVFQLRLAGGGGTNWPIIIEASTNLLQWQPIWTNQNGTGNFNDPLGPRTRRFYRARLP